MSRAFDRKQLARLMNEALQQNDNHRLMDCVPTLCAITSRTKEPQVLQSLFNSMVPMHLIKICASQSGPPNDQFLNYTLITIYNLTNDPENVDQFIQNGVIECIAMSNWYQDPLKDKTVVQNGIASLVNICSKTKRKLLPQQIEGIQKMIQICYQQHSKLKPLIQKLELALKKSQQVSGSKQKKKRFARNKKNNNNNNAPQGSYNPQNGQFQGRQNNNNNNNNNQRNARNMQQQRPPQQQNSSNWNGPVQSAQIQQPYQDADSNNNNQYQPQNNNNNNNNNNMQNPYQSQQNFGNNNN
eukprot:33893_1